MVYLVYSNLLPSIKNRTKSIIKEILGQVDEINYVRYDATEEPIQNCVDEANCLPLGYEKKVVLIENCYFLTKERVKVKFDGEQDYSSLIRFIMHPNDECNIVMSANSLSINEKNEVVLALKEKGKLIPINDVDESSWKSGVAHYCRDVLKMNIDSDALTELSDRTACDVSLLQNEATKLSLYKDHITYDDVVLMVTRPLEDNAFQIFNCLLNGNNVGALAIFRDLKVANIEPVVLISMLASQFRKLDEVQYLSSLGLNNEEIALELAIKSARVSYMKKDAYKISSECLHRVLNDLFELDLQIKNGLIDRFYAFELFLINFKRK